jgi:hypothetical protein
MIVKKPNQITLTNYWTMDERGKDWNARLCFSKAALLKVRAYWSFQLLRKDILFRKILATNYLTTTK